MDRDLAQIMVATGAKASQELGVLYDVLKMFLPENKELRNGVADALAEIGIKVLQPAFKAFPELEADMERRVRLYGRMI